MKTTISKGLFIILLLITGVSSAQVFTNYTTTEGLPDNFINGGVAVDTNNNKWFGTAAGVAKYDGSVWTVYDTADGLIDMYTSCIAVDINNNVWVGTANGVSMFNGTSWTSFTTAEGLVDNGVVYIAGEADGSVWFATTAGVSKYSGGTWTSYKMADGLPTDNVDCIAIDPAGNKWFGTQMGGAAIFDNSSFDTINTVIMDSLLDNNVFAIGIGPDGHKWLGTWYGITEIDAANNWLKNYRLADGLLNDFVHDIDFDTNGVMWVGLFDVYNLDGGISRFDGTNWASYTIADGLADKQVIRIAVDHDNAVWIATGNGVSKLVDLSAIRDNSGVPAISIYPNPATDVVHIKLSGKPTAGTSEIELYSTIQKVASYTISGNDDNATLPLDGLSAGLYFVRTGNTVAKFIIQK